MKRIVTFYIFACIIGIHVFAQYSYQFQGEKIQLKADSSMYFVQTTNTKAATDQIQTLTDRLQKKVVKSFNKLSDNRFLIVGSKGSEEQKNYYSQIYRNDKNNIIIILPRVVIQLKEGYTIDAILKTFSSQFDIDKGNRRKYILKLHTLKSEDVLKIVDDLSRRNEVEWCEPEMLSEIQLYNTLYSQQYYLNNTGQNGGTVGIDINVVPAWNITNGSSNITVAVIDGGVDQNHEDMGNRVLNGYTIRNATGLGAPQNENTLDTKSHGMACAGIIAASNNTIGIRGVSNNVQILPINIVPDAAYTDYYDRTILGYGSNIEIAQAINWAWHRADVLSNSWGSSNATSNEIVSAIDSARTYGRNGKGTIVIFASGNNYPASSNVTFPGNVNGVITVGAINNQGTIWGYSQRGASMDLVAPTGNVDLNGDVTTTDRMGTLGYNSNNYLNNFGGTSAACPQVAGVAALMLSVNPELTETQVRTTLQNTARDLGPAGFDNTYGYGLVNAYAAVSAVMHSISGPSHACPGEDMSFYIPDLPPSTPIEWSQNPYVTRVSPQGSNPCTFRCAENYSVSISANVVIGGVSINLTKVVEMGRGYYDYKDFLLQVWSSTGQLINMEGPECLCENQTYDLVMVNNGYSQVSTYNWTIPPYWTLISSNNNTIQINTGSTPEGNIDVSVTNPCGNEEGIASTYLLPNFYCGGGYRLSPNPASDAVTININPSTTTSNSKLTTTVANKQKETDSYSVKVIDSFSSIVYTAIKNSKQFTIPTATWNNGVYTIIVSDGIKSYQRKLVVKH